MAASIAAICMAACMAVYMAVCVAACMAACMALGMPAELDFLSLAWHGILYCSVYGSLYGSTTKQICITVATQAQYWAIIDF